MNKFLSVAFLCLALAATCAAQTQGQITSPGANCAIGSVSTNCVWLQIPQTISQVGITVGPSTFSGTLQFEATADGGTTWTAINASANGAAGVTSTTANGVWIANVGGYSFIRVRASAFASGVATVTLNPSQAAAAGSGSGVTPGSSCGDASHALGWTGTAYNCQSITGSALAGGSNTQLQWNNATALGGISGFTTNGTTTITGGASSIFDMHSGASVFLPGGLATGLVTVTTATGALSSTALPLSATNGGTGISTSASTGVPQVNSGTWTVSTTLPSGLSATNLTMVTPALGTPASGVITNLTGTCTTCNVGGNAATVTTPAALASSTATTQAAGDNSTKIATTAYVDANTTVCNAGSFTAQTDGTTVTWAIASVKCANAALTFTVHSGSRTLNLTGLVSGGYYQLVLKQDATGGENLTGGTGCTWKQNGGGGSTFTLATGASAINLLTFTYDGTNCYASLGGAYS
jgi:hypothetical protein